MRKLDPPFFAGGVPDIIPDGWRVDLLLELGPSTLETVDAALAGDNGFCFSCKRCSQVLRPWQDDNVYVLRYHLEEHYGIPTETGEQRRASEQMRRAIATLYDNRCFGCGATERKLHIDHVVPQARGGDAAFRNLQPLCAICGNATADSLPVEVSVFSDVYFLPEPSDSYEGLFW